MAQHQAKTCECDPVLTSTYQVVRAGLQTNPQHAVYTTSRHQEIPYAKVVDCFSSNMLERTLEAIKNGAKTRSISTLFEAHFPHQIPRTVISNENSNSYKWAP